VKPNGYARHGGPPVIELDDTLKILAGRSLDRLLTTVYRKRSPSYVRSSEDILFVVID
jgi:hypothetical protein